MIPIEIVHLPATCHLQSHEGRWVDGPRLPLKLNLPPGTGVESPWDGKTIGKS